MNAAEIARHLHGTRNGSHGWLVRCPAHEDRSPSLSIKDGNSVPLIVRCFGGCDSRDVLAEFRKAGYLGKTDDAKPYVAPAFDPAADQQEAQRMMRVAKALWRTAEPATGNRVQAYRERRPFHYSHR